MENEQEQVEQVPEVVQPPADEPPAEDPAAEFLAAHSGVDGPGYVQADPDGTFSVHVKHGDGYGIVGSCFSEEDAAAMLQEHLKATDPE